MDAGLPMIYVDTLEKVKAVNQIKSIAEANNRGIIEWSICGLRDYTDGANTNIDLSGALDLLISDKENLVNKIFLLTDAHYYLETPEVMARIRTIAEAVEQGFIEDCTIVLIAPMLLVPKELEQYVTVMNLEYMTQDEIRAFVVKFLTDQEQPIPKDDFLDKLTMLLKGLSETEVVNILSLAITDDGVLDYTDFALVLDQKQQMIKKSGILEMVPLKENMNDIGGLENLKSWLIRKAEVFQNIKQAQQFGVDIPKGVLIAGMPGCGKSLTAKAAAKTFNVPLLRLDMGRLMGKYVGESESNMRRAIQLTEASSPCVLWIDELEKAFAGISGSGGSEVTTRLFGNFLTWMQEKNSLAFVVATANNIAQLPPELLRKGRFDEIFYVDLPNEKEREKIFKIHISKRRGNDLANISLETLVKNTKGYCGADIEGVVKDSIEAAFVGKKVALSTEDVLEAINNTHSLSEIMKEKLDDMAKIYRERKFKNASV